MLVYDLLFKTASETMLTITADPRHLGARIDITAVLHTWRSAMTHHPRVHVILPGAASPLKGNPRVSPRPAFLLPVRVLGKLLWRLFPNRQVALHDAGASPSSDRSRTSPSVGIPAPTGSHLVKRLSLLVALLKLI